MFVMFRNVFIQKKLLSLKIECDYLKCKGACCKGEGLGTPLKSSDIERLRKVCDNDSFFHYYRGPRLVCRTNGDCNLLNDNMCTVNSIKPDFCTLFPLHIERRQGADYLFFHSYEECFFKESETHYLMQVSHVLKRIYGEEFVKQLRDILV